MRVVFVNRYFHPDHSATSQILSALAFDLAKIDYDVHVITSRQLYEDSKAELPTTEVVRGVTIHRVATTRRGRGTFGGRAQDMATFHLAAAWKTWRLVRRGDVVVAKTDPPLLSLSIAPIARMCGAMPVNWLQDIFPEIASALGVGGSPGRRLLFPLLKELRNLSLRISSINVVIGEGSALHLASQGISSNNIRVIPNWADPTAVRPVPRDANALRKEWGLDGKFVIGYSGNLGRAHDVDTLLDAMERVSRMSAPNGSQSEISREIAFLFIGNGALRPLLEAQVARRGLRNVVLKPYQPVERLSESLSAADVHIVSLKPELEGLIVPSKFYGVAAAGRPTIFIGDSKGEIPGLLRQADCGLTVHSGDAAGLTRTIVDLARTCQAVEAMGTRARALVEQRFSKSLAVDHWVDMLEGLARSRQTSLARADAAHAS